MTYSLTRQQRGDIRKPTLRASNSEPNRATGSAGMESMTLTGFRCYKSSVFDASTRGLAVTVLVNSPQQDRCVLITVT
jgi:hypothetical protein